MYSLEFTPPQLKYFGPDNSNNIGGVQEALTAFQSSMFAEHAAALEAQKYVWPQSGGLRAIESPGGCLWSVVGNAESLGLAFGEAPLPEGRYTDDIGAPPLGSLDYFLQLITDHTDVEEHGWGVSLSQLQDRTSIRLTPYLGVKSMRGVIALAVDREVSGRTFSDSRKAKSPLDAITSRESHTVLVHTQKQLDTILSVLSKIMRGEVEREQRIPLVLGRTATATEVQR